MDRRNNEDEDDDDVNDYRDDEEAAAVVAQIKKEGNNKPNNDDYDDTNWQDDDEDSIEKKKQFDIDDISFSTDESNDSNSNGVEEKEGFFTANKSIKLQADRALEGGIESRSINPFPSIQPKKNTRNVARKTVLHSIGINTDTTANANSDSDSVQIDEEKVTTKTAKKNEKSIVTKSLKKSNKSTTQTRKSISSSLYRKNKRGGGIDEAYDVQLQKAIYCAVQTTIDDKNKCCDCDCNCNGTAIIPLDGEFERVANEYEIDVTIVSNVWQCGQLLVIQDIIRMAATNVFKLTEQEASIISIHPGRSRRRPATNAASSKYKSSKNANESVGEELLTLGLVTAAAKACDIQPNFASDQTSTIHKPPLMLRSSKSLSTPSNKSSNRNNNSQNNIYESDEDDDDKSAVSKGTESLNQEKQKSSKKKKQSVGKEGNLAKKTVSSSSKRKPDDDDGNNESSNANKRLKGNKKSSKKNKNKQGDMLLTDSESDGESDSVSNSSVSFTRNKDDDKNNTTGDGTKRQRRYMSEFEREAVFYVLQSKYDHKLDKIPHGQLRKVGKKFNVSRNVVSVIWKRGIQSIQEQKEKLQLAADAGDAAAAVALASGNIRPDVSTRKHRSGRTRKYDPVQVSAMIDAIPLSERKSIRQTARLIGMSDAGLRRILKKTNPKPDTIDTNEIELKLQLKQQRIMSNRIKCGVRNDKARYRKKLEKTQQQGTTAAGQLMDNNAGVDGGTNPVLPSAITANGDEESVLTHERGAVAMSGSSLYQQQQQAATSAIAAAADKNNENIPYIGFLTAASQHHQQQAFIQPHVTTYHPAISGINGDFPQHQIQYQQDNQQHLVRHPTQAPAGRRSESYWY